jgi:PTH2 family peptidyl-tRNA hydrolase
MKSLADAMTKVVDESGATIGLSLTYTDSENDKELKEWLNGSFTKIVVYVKSEEKLMQLYEKVQKAGLRVSLIIDNGTTEFGGVKTKTCIAIGPHSAERIDPFTKKYPLLK